MVSVVNSRRVSWWFRGTSVLVVIVALAAGCRRGEPTVSTPAVETMARTAFTERVENFFEYTPPATGKTSRLTIHLTDLSDGSPLDGAEVTLTARSTSRDAPTETKARSGRVPGIYLADVAAHLGELPDVEFRVRTARLDERMTVSGLAATAPASVGTTVPFTMEQQWAIRMKLAQTVAATVARQITAPGRIVPAAGHHAMVAPPVSGLITSATLPRVSQTVARGETIATLRNVPTSAEVAQIEVRHVEELRLAAERRRTASAVAETEVRLAQARRDHERARELYERGAYSLRQREVAESELKAAEAARATVIAQRDALHDEASAVPGSRSTPTVYTITAPISGTIVRVAKSPGEQVGAGEVILEIVALDTVWVEVSVFERDLPRLAAMKTVRFAAPGRQDVEVIGRLVSRGAVIDPRSRAATVLFEVPNTDHRLPVGLAVEARLDASESLQAVLVPREAILESEGKRFGYVLRSGEAFERREVTVGDERGATVAVLSGLSAGDRVVTQGAWQLRQQELRPASAGPHTHE